MPCTPPPPQELYATDPRGYAVVCEARTRREAQKALDSIKVSGCGIYAEVGGKLYRVMCEQTSIKTGLTR